MSSIKSGSSGSFSGQGKARCGRFLNDVVVGVSMERTRRPRRYSKIQRSRPLADVTGRRGGDSCSHLRKERADMWKGVRGGR